MNLQVQKYINEAVKQMINNSASDKKLKKIRTIHEKKIHFIPKKYRVLSGILQSLNIQFGNFIEELMKTLVQDNKKYEIVEELSGKKNSTFFLARSTDQFIDDYISRCQTDNIDIDKEFPKLLEFIVNNKDNDMISIKHDIDLLFRSKENQKYYYLEIKYNDDHDTGKFMDINRKFIKTYAYLVNYLNIQDSKNLVPILFFFNNKKLKGNIYIPEKTNIFRGRRFFDEFLDISYKDIDECMSTVSESSDTYEIFDDLYQKIRNGR